MKKIILASASPRRKELLRRVGIEFSVVPSKSKEVTYRTMPEEAVKELSYQKAREVFEKGNRDSIDAAFESSLTSFVPFAETLLSSTGSEQKSM